MTYLNVNLLLNPSLNEKKFFSNAPVYPAIIHKNLCLLSDKFCPFHLI
jgi:hypothetical protein